VDDFQLLSQPIKIALIFQLMLAISPVPGEQITVQYEEVERVSRRWRG